MVDKNLEERLSNEQKTNPVKNEQEEKAKIKLCDLIELLIRIYGLFSKTMLDVIAGMS